MRVARMGMRKIAYSLFTCTAVLLLISCNDFKHLSERGKLMVKTKQNLLRGLDFDMNLKEVKEFEGIPPELEYPDYLRYHVAADSVAKGESLDIEYFFNKKNQLDLMIIFYNISDSNAIHPVADELMRYLEREHGRPKKDELGWYHWEFEDKTGESGIIEINLMGETEAGYMGVELEMIKYYAYEEKARK